MIMLSLLWSVLNEASKWHDVKGEKKFKIVFGLGTSLYNVT